MSSKRIPKLSEKARIAANELNKKRQHPDGAASALQSKRAKNAPCNPSPGLDPESGADSDVIEIEPASITPEEELSSFLLMSGKKVSNC